MPDLVAGDEFQAFLDSIANAIRAGDFGAFERHVALPGVMISAQGTRLITERDDLRAGFEGYVAAVRGHGVTDYVRIASSFTRVGPGLATGVYETHMLRNGTRVVEPYSTAVMLRRDDGAWRATAFLLALTHDRWRFRLPGSDRDPDDGAWA